MLDKNTYISKRTAQAYMRVARHFPRLGNKSATVALLSFRDALAQLATHAQTVARLPEPAAVAALEGRGKNR